MWSVIVFGTAKLFCHDVGERTAIVDDDGPTLKAPPPTHMRTHSNNEMAVQAEVSASKRKRKYRISGDKTLFL